MTPLERNGDILMRPSDKDIEKVIAEALDRYEAGRLEHGQLDLARDNRDYIEEAIQELLDCINYSVFQILRLRRLRIAEKEGQKTPKGC